jgi:hypothetical protein
MSCYSVTKIEDNNLEQRHAISFCQAGEATTDIYEEIQKAFGDDAVSRAQVFRSHKGSLNGRGTVEDEPRSGRPASVRTSTNVDRVRVFIR